MSDFSDITVNLWEFDDDIYPIVRAIIDFRMNDEMPVLDYTYYDSTLIGPVYLYNFYNAFRNLVYGYLDFVARDLCSVADMASSLFQYDNQYANGSVDTGLRLAIDLNRSDYDPASLSLSFSVDSNIAMAENWIYYKGEVDRQMAETLTYIYRLLRFIPDFKTSIQGLLNSTNFTGAAADAAKNYFAQIHLFACDALYVCAQNAFIHISRYWTPLHNAPNLQDGDLDCYIVKANLVNFVSYLQYEKDLINEWYPGIATHNTTLATETNNAYDYSLSLTCLYSLPDYIDSTIARCTDLIDAIETYEPTVITDIGPELEEVTMDFYNFASQLTGLTIDNFISPPVDLNTTYNLDEYRSRFQAVQTQNEVEFAGVINEGLDDTIEVTTELAIEAEIERRGYEIAGSCIAIVAAIASIVASAGSDTPFAVCVIGNACAILFSSAEIVENVDEINQLRNGDIDPEGFNFVRDTTLCWIQDPDARDVVYIVATRFATSATTLYEGAFDEVVTNAVAEGSMTIAGADGSVVEIIMVPVELINAGGLQRNAQGVIDGLGYAANTYCNVNELLVEDQYVAWAENYNEAASYGVVGCAGFTNQ